MAPKLTDAHYLASSVASRSSQHSVTEGKSPRKELPTNPDDLLELKTFYMTAYIKLVKEKELLNIKV